MRHLLISLAVFFVLFSTAFGQINTLSVGPAGIQAFEDDSLTIPLDTVIIGLPIHYKVPIFNDGQAAIQDTSTFDILCVTSLDSVERSIGTFLLDGSVIPLQPLDSLPESPVGVDTASADRYGGGGGVVVIIWPSARQPGFAVKDSGSLTVNVLSTGLETARFSNGLKVRIGPNPATQLINIDYGAELMSIEYVRIVDLNGRIVFNSDKTPTSIPLTPYPTGSYSLLITDKAGRKAVYRILKL